MNLMECEVSLNDSLVHSFHLKDSTTDVLGDIFSVLNFFSEDTHETEGSS